MEDKKPLYIASCSFGKDSVATLILAWLHNEPIDRVVSVEVMFDNENNITGEFPEHINWVRNVAIPKLNEMFEGRVVFDIVRPRHDYKYFFFRVVGKRTKHVERIGKIHGFLIAGKCHMNGEGKMDAIRKYYKNFGNTPIVQYVGIAANESERLRRLKDNAISLLQKYNVTEEGAFELCKQYGLLSPQYKDSRRNGCWFCPYTHDDRRCKFRKEHPEMWNEFAKWAKTPNKVSEIFSRDRTFDQVVRRMDIMDSQTEIQFPL